MGAMKSWMMDMEQTVIDVVAELPEEATEAQIINECSNRMHIIDKEYVKQCDFIMENSLLLPVDFIKYAELQIDRKANVKQIDDIINCITISEDIEKGIFEFSLLHITNCNLNYNLFESVYIDKLNDLYCNIDINDKKINNKTLCS